MQLSNSILLYLICLFKDEIHDGGSDREDQRWNNSSDDDNDDDGGAEYNWEGLNKQKKSEKQTKGKFKKKIKLVLIYLVNKKLINK